MKEYVVPPDLNCLTEYTAVVLDDENSAPDVYIGTGKTAEEALSIAKERYEKVCHD